MADVGSDSVEEIPLHPNDICIALEDFGGGEDEDLPFCKGDKITIVKPTEAMFWYIGKNLSGETGSVPSTLLKPLSETPPLPPKPKLVLASVPIDTEGYERMGAAPIMPKHSKPKPMSKDEKEVLRLLEKEKVKRLMKGTLVVATATFHAEKAQDMAFEVHEEMTLLKPTPDLCWYFAQKVENPSQKGIIPITHVRLVYMSDEEKDEQIYKKPKNPGHDRWYDDINDFVSQSGWFTFPGFALGTEEALLHVLAHKANINYEDFMKIENAVYVFTYEKDEKKFVGKANVLHKELLKHFDCFEKSRSDIREIDDELCHHTHSSGWQLIIYMEFNVEDLELEWTKKIIEHDSLASKDGGINENMIFTNMVTFDKFWEWLSPN